MRHNSEGEAPATVTRDTGSAGSTACAGWRRDEDAGGARVLAELVATGDIELTVTS